MCKCDNFVKADSITVETDATTSEEYLQITVPATTDFVAGDWAIGLFTTIPNTVRGARISITNGTDSYDVLRCNGNYWRPCCLKCRSVLRCSFLTDPEHFLVYAR